MTIKSLMVHLELGRSNVNLLRIVGDLAERFQASVIGIAAGQPINMVYGDGMVAGDLFEADRDEIARQVTEAEAEFLAAFKARSTPIAWRSAVRYSMLGDYLASEARCADLVVSGVASNNWLDSSRDVNTGDFVMRVGRPVLIVPADATHLPLAHVLVGWKETREARRAVLDALPLLQQAAKVTVLEIAPQDHLGTARAHLADVVHWLALHGVRAEALASPSTGDDSTALYAIAQDQAADLIVAGAYGHSRVREWVLGGVTHDLLRGTQRCSLLSH